jgi:hypothetical protein
MPRKAYIYKIVKIRWCAKHGINETTENEANTGYHEQIGGYLQGRDHVFALTHQVRFICSPTQRLSGPRNFGDEQMARKDIRFLANNTHDADRMRISSC